METEQYHGRLFLIGVSILILSIFVILTIITINQQSSPTQGVVQTTQNPGQLSLKTQDGLNSYPVQQQVTILVSIDSGGDVVSGYDVDLSYGEGTTFVKAQSLLPDFTIATTSKIGNVIITGYKKLSAQNTLLANTPVVALTFQLIGPGSINFQPLLTVGETSKSNIINAQNKNILGKVEGITLQSQ